jgi:hypothetical protein
MDAPLRFNVPPHVTIQNCPHTYSILKNTFFNMSENKIGLMKFGENECRWNKIQHDTN